jgi:protease-4
MALSAATLLERARLRLSVRKWRGLALFCLLMLLLSFPYIKLNKLSGGDYIARITIDNIIMFDQYRNDILKQLAKDDKVKAVMLKIDSPGGTVVGGESLYNNIRKISEKKPVAVLMGSTATSAAYMAAIAGDRIFAYNGTVTGSIGVIMQSFEATSLAEKIGIKPIIIKSSPLKATPNPLEKFSPQAEEALKHTVKDIHNMFIDMVIARRTNSKSSKIRDLADGRVFTGREALQLGLIDEIGSEDDAKSWLVTKRGIKSDLEIKDVLLIKKDSYSIFEKFFSLWRDYPTNSRHSLLSIW